MGAIALDRSIRRIILTGIFLVALYGIVAFALVLPSLLSTNDALMREGQVAPQDIQAPHTLTYVSSVLTERARQEAARTVPAVYTAPDPAIARAQRERLRYALAYITNVRADPYATLEQKLADLALLEDLYLSPEQARAILNLNDLRWQAIQQEAIVVLEQAMREAIRENRVAEMRRNLPMMVSLALSEEQAELVVALVEPFIVANSFYNEQLTLSAKEKAAREVAPVVRTFQAGETIIQRGRVLKAEDIEALQVFGLVQPKPGVDFWLQSVLVSFLVVTFFFLYLRRKKSISSDARLLTVFLALSLAFLFAARSLPADGLFPYVFPYAAFSMAIAALVMNSDMALLSSVGLAILSAYAQPNALEHLMYILVSSQFSVLALGKARRIVSFIIAGLTAGAAGALILIVLSRLSGVTEVFSLAYLAAAAVFGGIASAGLALLLQFVSAQYLGLSTALHLMDISRPDHPLLRMLLTNAPGTYQHSLQVANLAEQAAERIHADVLLVRVGALYHDIGKALNPAFYIENQVAGAANPHDQLDPILSAKIILSHVSDGLKLARKYRLPRRIQDFIAEHHGTMIARYQYARAVQLAGGDESKVDIEQFRYPGPKPRSRETAILMLADGCEAKVRAERPKDEQELRRVIKSVFDHRIAMGQLDETPLTLRDLSELMDAFTTALRNVYHPRLVYPQLEEAISSSKERLEEVIFSGETPIPVEIGQPLAEQVKDQP
ncbi:MAG: HDIG domain-containing protein [Anaerolineales bacterium]|nr:HDIG domain-containing protein [Anaerolineales bacterium]MDW8447911.1 HDIG domain-containing protein [Anaerolineales bacterium]